MEYNDFALMEPKVVERLAKEYSKSLQKMGFMFVRINNENDERTIIIEQIQSNYVKLKYLANYLIKYLPNKYKDAKHKLKLWILELENSLYDIILDFKTVENRITFNGLNDVIKILCQLFSDLGTAFISLKKYSSAFEQQKLEDLIYLMFQGLKIVNEN